MWAVMQGSTLRKRRAGNRHRREGGQRRCLSKQVTTLGNWSLVLPGNSGNQCANMPQTYLCREERALEGLFLPVPSVIFMRFEAFSLCSGWEINALTLLAFLAHRQTWVKLSEKVHRQRIIATGCWKSGPYKLEDMGMALPQDCLPAGRKSSQSLEGTEVRSWKTGTLQKEVSLSCTPQLWLKLEVGQRQIEHQPCV